MLNWYYHSLIDRNNEDLIGKDFALHYYDNEYEIERYSKDNYIIIGNNHCYFDYLSVCEKKATFSQYSLNIFINKYLGTELKIIFPTEAQDCTKIIKDCLEQSKLIDISFPSPYVVRKNSNSVGFKTKKFIITNYIIRETPERGLCVVYCQDETLLHDFGR